MSITSNKSVSPVKNMIELKKVLPKVKIFGSDCITLNEMTRDHNKTIMETNIVSKEKLNKYCRACAGLKIPLVDIFSEKGFQMRLNQQMKHLENIDEHDSLSTQMCMDCICDLKMSYKFFMQIKKAQMKLQSIHVSMVATARAQEKKVQLANVKINVPLAENTASTANSSRKNSVSPSISSKSTTDESTYIDTDLSQVSTVVADLKLEENDHEMLEEYRDDDYPLATDNIKSEQDISSDHYPSQESTDQFNTESCSTRTDGSMTGETLDEVNADVSGHDYTTEELSTYIKLSPEKSTTSVTQFHAESVKATNDVDNSTSSGLKEGSKQPNILKRKSSQSKSEESANKNAKVHKLNTVNISPSDEEGIMYVTVKGSKPNEMLLVKVKKMDKVCEKKDDKSVKKISDAKPAEKVIPASQTKDIFADNSKKSDAQNIEQQIEEYKKKREKILGGTSTSHFRDPLKYVDNTIRFLNPSGALSEPTGSRSFTETSAIVKIDLTVDPPEDDSLTVEKESSPSDSAEPQDSHESEHETTREYLARLALIKQKWEEAKMKKESLQRELDESYSEGNREKLSRILGEKEKNLQDFQNYLKQRKIVITRLKDEDIISLYEDRNSATIPKKLPDLIDENPPVDALTGDPNILDCDYCPMLFSDRDTLEEHLKTHDYRLVYYCEDCGGEFPSNKAKRAHNITCLKKLICKYCDFMLESRGKKRQHEQKHCDGIYGQLCDVCGEKFKHQGTLDQHIKTQHMSWEKIFQCPKCPKKFAFKQKLSFHVKSVHTTLRAYLCEDCGADFKNPASLRHHRIRKHQPTGNKRECPVCHKVVPFYSLSKHMYTHKAYSIQCPHCEKMFKNSSTLKQHIRIHEDQRQYRCDNCGVGFNRRDGLRLHMRVHQKSDSRALKECSCQICSEKFPNHSMLVIHRNRVHKDGKQYTCQICNRSMLSTRSLEWHMSHIHNQTPSGTKDETEPMPEKKRVSCIHCDKTFKTDMILRTHIKNTHMERNPVKCLDCELTFTSDVRLRHHMMVTHKRLEGTLTCPNCPKRFVNQLRLKTHMISHSEDRPYTCEICGFNLKTKIQLLKHHQNRHSDERPLHCRFCPWRCKQVSALVCHERTHTNERPYECIVCKQRFKYLGDKNKHERRHESLGGSGFKRHVTERSAKQSRNREGETSASDQDAPDQEQEFETIEAHLVDAEYEEQVEEFEDKFEDQQIIKFETQAIGEEYYDPSYAQEYEETSREASDAAGVILNMEDDGTAYEEEVTTDMATVEIIGDDGKNNQFLKSLGVIHLPREDENGKVRSIPVMIQLIPTNTTDETTEITLEDPSIMYNV